MASHQRGWPRSPTGRLGQDPPLRLTGYPAPRHPAVRAGDGSPALSQRVDQQQPVTMLGTVGGDGRHTRLRRPAIVADLDEDASRPEHKATVTLPPGSPDLLCMTEFVTSSLSRSTAVSVAGCSAPRSWRAMWRAALTACGVPGRTRSTGARTGAGVARSGALASCRPAAVICHPGRRSPAVLAGGSRRSYRCSE